MLYYCTYHITDIYARRHSESRIIAEIDAWCAAARTAAAKPARICLIGRTARPGLSSRVAARSGRIIQNPPRIPRGSFDPDRRHSAPRVAELSRTRFARDAAEMTSGGGAGGRVGPGRRRDRGRDRRGVPGGGKLRFGPRCQGVNFPRPAPQPPNPPPRRTTNAVHSLPTICTHSQGFMMNRGTGRAPATTCIRQQP